jgi:hypothetical protein
MTTYYGLYGQKVQYLASDPTDVQIGQVWYNSTSATLKVRAFSTASYASGGNMSTGQGLNAGAGTQTAALTFGGFNPSTGSAGSVITQTYNGTSWSPGGNLNFATYGANGCGPNTATFKQGGASPIGYQDKTEHYNGSSWTNQTSSPRGANSATSVGGQTAAIVCGGVDNTNPPATHWNQNCMLWTSSSWTNGPSFSNLLVGAQGAGSSGSQTAAIIFGGFLGPTPFTATGDASQTWNGSAFSNGPTMNQAGYRSGAGTQNAAIAFTGAVPAGNGNMTELYNGSSWTTSANFSTPRDDNQQNSGNSSPNSAAIIFGGRPGALTSTEEFTGAAAATKTVTVS